eukprot:TRINITY_DN1123_c0_g1_i1.p1 TRINITY_DN1123_c0_g1~~TRINITY_DN1123_c0_g1_i1.p1  ORF type:complete len:265 (+),score=68.74 TRINITY_DN1123_c0_g1_i1:122-916(+)
MRDEKKEEQEESYTIETTGLPEDRISHRELKLLEEMKEDPITKGFDDKTLLVFLVARNHSVSKALDRLKAYIKFNRENGYEGRTVKLSDLNPVLLKSMYAFSVPGTTSLNGNMISYLNPGSIRMKDFTVQEIFDHGLYFWQLSLSQEPLSSFRKGAIYVEDVSTTGLKNMDSSKMNKLKEIQSAFPIKVQAIYIIKTGAFMRFLMAFAKLFVKSKILKRTVALKTPEKIFEFIDPSNLHKDFGGALEFSYRQLPEDPQSKFRDY